MKLPKIKVKKLKISKKRKYQIAQIGCIFVSSLLTGMYGVLNYMEGQQSEWDYLTGDADKHGNVFFNDEGNRYFVAGKDLTAKIFDSVKSREKEAADEQRETE